MAVFAANVWQELSISQLLWIIRCKFLLSKFLSHSQVWMGLYPGEQRQCHHRYLSALRSPERTAVSSRAREASWQHTEIWNSTTGDNNKYANIFTVLPPSRWDDSLLTIRVSNIQKPRLGRYKTRSAMTKPTLKKRLEAGKKGIISRATAIVKTLENESGKNRGCQTNFLKI